MICQHPTERHDTRCGADGKTERVDGLVVMSVVAGSSSLVEGVVRVVGAF